ncbi:serine/threonine protein phosphatase [Aphanothece hegewaldii CCALA 016]|uniref:Serine/threonine protein phosphatase n=1 Tax=Aphanothece hegewaldii CCALA 016 TaxID=2107694 RepID=A0A2T1LQV6_9CHRO|nr:serine/threonine phosphatase [Aphanothece hegewaldii]PSF29839.1 serine/threonine protein phosphatase [Aphanothece hegewaldii CCALA 016]
MLVCPQCQYDNPNNNQSCQRCATSLTHKICHECGSEVPFDAENCPECLTFTGSVWTAIIAEPLHLINYKMEIQTLQQEVDLSSDLINKVIAATTTEDYLDSSRRYRLMPINDQTIVIDSTTHRYIQRKIVDCQPLQKSVLKILLEQHTELEEEHNNLSWLPDLAFPYVKLYDFSPAVPEIQDAWQEDFKEVLILPDRSEWQLLLDLWSHQSLPILQIVYWFDEMAKLWKSLTEVGYAQSLLVESNLRVDEDQTFGLERLYHDPADSELTLKDLAQCWQNLINRSLEAPSPFLTTVLEKVLEGEITTITDLRLQLQEIADEQQIHSLSYIADDLEEEDFSSPKFIPEKAINEEIASLNQGTDYLTTSPQEHSLIDHSDECSTAVIPMQMLSLTDAGYTDNGRQRRHNEDCFGIDSQVKKQQSNRGQRTQARGLYIVCDGMGGHAAGEVASAMAVLTLQRYFADCWGQELPDQETLTKGVFCANQAIYKVNQEKASQGSGRMGTTLVMALIQNTRMAIAHVGDSRIYRISRKWGLEQLSVDHEVGQRAIQEGVEPKIAYARSDAYQLTQALGPHDDYYLKPDIQFFDIVEDNLFLLCSDGLSDHQFIETHWQSHLSPLISSQFNLEEGLYKLIALANQKNGHDNITAILIRVKVQPNVEQSIW